MVNNCDIPLFIHEKHHAPSNLISSKSPTLPSGTPSTRKSKPTWGATTGRLSCRSECSPVTSRLKAGPIGSKPAFDHRRRPDVISSPAKRWVKAGEKVVEMSGQQTCALFQGCVRSGHDERHQEHCPRQPHHVKSDNEEGYLLAFIILRVRVGNAKNESCWR